MMLDGAGPVATCNIPVLIGNRHGAAPQGCYIRDIGGSMCGRRDLDAPTDTSAPTTSQLRHEASRADVRPSRHSWPYTRAPHDLRVQPCTVERGRGRPDCSCSQPRSARRRTACEQHRETFPASNLRRRLVVAGPRASSHRRRVQEAQSRLTRSILEISILAGSSLSP